MGAQPYSRAAADATVPDGFWRRAAVASLLMLLLAGLFIRLGFWQLDRAAEKTALQDSFSAAAEQAILRTPVSSAAASDIRFRRFELTGQYDPDHQILLESMVANGRNGYQVITPFRSGATTLLVNRGWLAAAADRAQLPDITLDAGVRTIRARLNKLPEPGIRLAAGNTQADDWPRRMLYPDQAAIVAALKQPVPDYQLLLEADQPDGYLRDWQAVGTGPQKNYGYAIQWFAFALLAVVLYIIVILRWKRHSNLRTAKVN